MSLDLFLETDPSQLWQPNWTAYLNQLCLTALLPWFQSEAPNSSVWVNTNVRHSFWNFVNGTAFTVNGLRFVVIPTEAIDHDELRIPQEWIDLPTWVGDYYLAAQVEPDEGWVSVWGYATHHSVKNQAQLDFNDRTYCLTSDQLANPELIWLTSDLCHPQLRAEVAALPGLSIKQANNLITRLSHPEILSPRLAIPFQSWGALMEHGGWRQRLYQSRLGLAQPSILDWLQSGVPNLFNWERLELQPTTAAARSADLAVPITLLSRVLEIAGQHYELQVIPQADETWRFELRNTSPGGMIPDSFKLRLLTEDLQNFEGNEAIAQTALDSLSIEVALEPGEGIVWETEPISQAYDREILRF
ncbi:MAG: DUF1822 family protein [Leptolyngbya sp. Prado105]|jgi:hypothetical protein|nr:DUF1822 family protein [Leptolyngbya sp. Prado105]